MHAERAQIGRLIQRNFSSIANCGMPQALPIASQLLRPNNLALRVAALDGVQLENRCWLSHKDALNQVIGFARSSWAADQRPAGDRPG
jgi:hypothetical protein